MKQITVMVTLSYPDPSMEPVVEDVAEQVEAVLNRAMEKHQFHGCSQIEAEGEED